MSRTRQQPERAPARERHPRARAHQRLEEAGQAALRASEALTRAQFATVPGGVS